jgi:hypothetical protein
VARRAWILLACAWVAPRGATADVSAPQPSSTTKAKVQRSRGGGGGGWTVGIDPGMYILYQPRDRSPGYVQAAQLFDHAETSYRSRHYREAANDFLAAASLLARSPDQPEWDVYAADRMLSLANAVVALDRIHALDEARAILVAAGRADPVCRPLIQAALRHLPLIDPARPDDF